MTGLHSGKGTEPMEKFAGRNERELQDSLREFYEEYINCLNDSEFDRWPSFFLDDAKYRITSRENFARNLPMAAMSCVGRREIQDRVTALQKVLVFEPRLCLGARVSNGQV